MTFGELQDEVNLSVIDTPTAIQTMVPTLIKRAVRKLQQRHNFMVMKATASFTTVVGARTLTRPTDWKEARGKPYVFEEDAGRPRDMFWGLDADLQAKHGVSLTLDIGMPRGLSEDDENAQLKIYPAPDGTSLYDDGEYRIYVPYWKFLPALSAASDTNWFTENADEYIVYQATADAFALNEDEDRADYWRKRAATEREDLINADKRRGAATVDVLVYHTGALRPHTQE